MSANLRRQAVLRIGEVSEVSGRMIFITVDRDKNLSDVFLDGDILRNIAVNGFVEIRKGFLSIIGRVEGEKVTEPQNGQRAIGGKTQHNRILTVSLSGYINEDGRFTGGTKELPLIGNEAYIITKETLHVIHNLVDKNEEDPLSISIATVEGVDVEFPVDGLFNSHIAIFGNTGSGKSNTLASIYQELFKALRHRNGHAFRANTQFVLFDFNGEYAAAHCICDDKKVYNLNTTHSLGDRIPIDEDDLLDIEFLSILSDATEKTQKPFIRRALALVRRVREANDPQAYLVAIVRNLVRDTLRMSDRVRAQLLINYFEQILRPILDENEEIIPLDEDIEWHSVSSGYKLRYGTGAFFNSSPDRIGDTRIYQNAQHVIIDEDPLIQVTTCLYVQLMLFCTEN